MKVPTFEVVLDHNDPAHHDRLEKLSADLLAWARKWQVTRVEREDIQLRPGVMRLRFFPAAPAHKPVLGGDRLVLSRA